MAETAEEQQHENHPAEQPDPPPAAAAASDGDEAEKKRATLPPSMTFSIWPPSQRTREAVINRLVETLSKESILSKRYGTVPHDEAAAAARQIEEEAFAAAAAAATAEDAAAPAEDAEIETLQAYSKEISKRMLSTIKGRASASPPSPLETPASSVADSIAGQEVPSAESESS